MIEEIDRILVVEDEKNLLRIFEAGISRYVKTIEKAEDGEKGIEVFKKSGGFPVVVTDVAMPLMNGLEMATEIKKISPTTQFVFVSGVIDDAVGLKIMKVDGICLPKPTEPSLIWLAIVQAYRKHKRERWMEKLEGVLAERP